MKTVPALIILCMSLMSHAQSFPRLSEQFRLKQLELPERKVRIVLDTDTYNEVDDQFALSYAILSKEKLQLEAVYAAPFKNERSLTPADGMEKSYLEINRLLAMLGKSPEGFAVRGSDKYLENAFTPVRSDAALDLVKKALISTPEDPLYVVAIGCLTNVASALLIEPSIIRNIVVVWLGGNDLNWPHQKEFNLQQDILSARVVLNSGVPLMIMPCRPVVSHFHTTIPELEFYLKGKNELSDYLLKTVIDYSRGSKVWSKVIWDVTAVALLVNPAWIQTNLFHSPVMTDQITYSSDYTSHFIRMGTSLNRDAIFLDLFEKLSKSVK